MSELPETLPAGREVSLVEILDRALGAGVVITGDITLSLADVELVYVDLRLLVSSIGTLQEGSRDRGGGGPSLGPPGRAR